MIVRRSLLRHSRRLLQSSTCQTTARNTASESRRTQSTLSDGPKERTSIVPSGLDAENDSFVLSTQQQGSKIDPVIDAYHAAKHIENTTGRLGSEVSPAYEPNQFLIDPPRPSDVTLELLLASQAHLGHATSLWNPANSRYIFGIREGIHIISLEVIASHLRRAAKIVTGVAEQGGIILFVGTRPGLERCVVKAAELTGGCHLYERWTPGAITNGEQILGKCARKLVNEFDEEVPGYEDQLLDLPVLKPDLVVCLNTLENEVMLHECALANIPTIGVIDTDANPTWVTYPIPANDDSTRCMYVIAGVLGRAGEEGRRRRLEAAKMGQINYIPETRLVQLQQGGDEVDMLDATDNDNAPRDRSRGDVESGGLGGSQDGIGWQETRSHNRKNSRSPSGE